MFSTIKRELRKYIFIVVGVAVLISFIRSEKFVVLFLVRKEYE